jgi:arsenate reductase
MTTTTVFGIPNCDTVKRARAWLAEQGVVHQFHDFKKAGLPAALLQGWVDRLGWEPLLNKRGTTWRQLTPQVQGTVTDAHSAQALMLAQPSLVKRPVVAWADGRLTVGFDAQQWADTADAKAKRG